MEHEHVITIETQTKAFEKLDVFLPPELKALENDLNNLGKELASKVEKSKTPLLQDLAIKDVELQRKSLQFYKSVHSGKLLNSFLIRLTGEKASIGTDKWYAKYLEEGRPEVKPVNKRFLHYFTKEGKEVFSRYSKPAKPRPWLTRSSKHLETQLNKININKYLK